MQTDDFDDIASLLNDVLDEKPVEIPEPETPPKAATVVVEAQTPEGDGDILGEFLNEVATVSEGIPDSSIPSGVITHQSTPEAPEPAESNEISDVEDMLAEITGDASLPVEGMGEQAEEAGASELTQCVTQEHVFAETVEKAALPMPTFTTDELAESIDIRNFATLVTLNTSRWHAKVKDRKAAQDAADASGADKNAFEARKKLLAGCDDELRAVHKEIDIARAEHYRLTMPWSSVGVNDIGKRSGGRLMPNTLFLEYTAAMAKCKASMEAALALFEKKYPSLIAVAQKKLGKAFDPAQYPNPSSIRQHFNLSFDFNPIPVGTDFKGLQQAQVDKLGAALNRKTRVMLENAMQDVWKTLYEAVSHAHSTLADPSKMFHKSLIEKLQDQSNLLKHLNATGSKEIAQVANLISGDLVKFDPKDIRKDDALRKRLAETAKQIVKYMEGVADAQAQN